MPNPQHELDVAQSFDSKAGYRMLPQDENAEKGVLCSFLLDPRAVGQICSEKGISAVHFYVPRNAIFFELLMEFWRDNEPIDYVTLTSCLRSRNQIDLFHGGPWITDVSTFVGTAANVGHYLETLEEKAVIRELIKTCTKFGSKGYDEQEDVPLLVNGLMAEASNILKLMEGRRQHSRDMQSLVKIALDEFEADLLKNGVLDMPTGISALDYYTDGLVAPEVTAVLAKPSDFKTALSLSIALHLACDHGKSIGYISLEMGDVQLTKRMLFSRAGVDIRRVKRRREIYPDEGARLCKAGEELSAAKIHIRDDGAMNIAEIVATATGWKSKHGLDLLIIDHAQLAKGTKKSNSRTEEVEEVSNALKPLAKLLSIPVMILSQVTESTSNGETMYSAKQSKAIEADADNIWTLSHDRDSKTGAIVRSRIRLDKQRDRERFVTVPVTVIPEFQRFTDVVSEPEGAQAADVLDFYSKPDSKKKR